MSRLVMSAATAILLSITADAALSQDVHENPEPEPGTLKEVQVEVRAGKLYDARDLASSGLTEDDLIRVTSFDSSGIIDGSSRND